MAKALLEYLVTSIKSMRGGKTLEIFAILKNEVETLGNWES